MNTYAKLMSLGMLVLVAAGCAATGPKYAEIKSSVPALSPDNGRVVFYRSGTIIGAGIQPSVKLNGNIVGGSKPGGFFYVDVAPGDYEVVLSTEVDKKLTFKLEKQQQRCVRMSVGLGAVVYRVYPELVDSAVCDSELQTLSYTGSALSMLSAPVLAQSSGDWVDIKDPKELRAIYSNKTFRGNLGDGSPFVGHFRSDGKGILIAGGQRIPRTWEVKGDDWVCVAAGSGPANCYRFQRNRNRPNEFVAISVTRGARSNFTVEDGVPEF